MPSKTINEWCRLVHANAINKGFAYKARKRPVPELLCLIHSETSEALEAYRQNSFLKLSEELADICIRVFDMAEEYEIDLEYEIEKKHIINLQRPYKHHGKVI